jgi:pimeloyl-ACP methyl ester carboxylesterase
LSVIHYRDQGKGFPLIFIHGFCETHEIWKLVADSLSSDFRVITIDLPGFGKSTALPAPHSLDDVADTLLDFIQNKLKLSLCAVMGHSLGGYIVLAMIEKDPARFPCFGLIHSTAYPDSEERKANRLKVIDFVQAHGVKPFIESFIPPLFYDLSNPHIPATVALASTTPMQTLVSYTQAMRLRPDRTTVIQSFNKPILIVAGREDKIISLESVTLLASLSINVHLIVLDCVAHMGMLEDSEEVIDTIQNFIQGVPLPTL